MCIILDANCLGLFTNADQSMLPVKEYFENSGGLAIGGSKLSSEYKRNSKIIKFLAELARKGQILRLVDKDVNSKESEILKAGICQSDDPHILAIAALSNARVLVSHDQPLHKDFTSTTFFTPMGKIYQNQTHARLLSKLPKCS
jgi:hypothetical protein